MTKDIHPRKREFIRLFEESGWSQADAARELDMTRGGVNGIITGDTEPSAALLKFFKLVLLSKGNAGKFVDETFTEQWFNDLLFELKALPEPALIALVVSCGQLRSPGWTNSVHVNNFAGCPYFLLFYLGLRPFCSGIHSNRVSRETRFPCL